MPPSGATMAVGQRFDLRVEAKVTARRRAIERDARWPRHHDAQRPRA
jgi:hypothetical protein